MSELIIQPEIDEALRYMGCPPDKADPATRRLAEECAGQIAQLAVPRWRYRVFPIVRQDEGVVLDGGLLLPGQDLKKHWAHCTQGVLFALTLSAGVDLAIRRAQSVDMARALALDCCASAAVEQACDQVEERLQGMFPGCFFPFRFSPGYGDLPLEVQSPLLALLDAPRRMGLCTTQTHLLTPRKSVTALLGVADKPIDIAARSCLNCPAQASCQYRKSGGHCGSS